MSDLAQHSRESLRQVFGEFPMCIGKDCINRAQDWHHIKKRGNAKDKEDRKIHSSVFNAAPLCRGKDCHESGKKHRKETEEYYLKRVRSIIALSSYELIEIDRQFLEKYSEYYK